LRANAEAKTWSQTCRKASQAGDNPSRRISGAGPEAPVTAPDFLGSTCRRSLTMVHLYKQQKDTAPYQARLGLIVVGESSILDFGTTSIMPTSVAARIQGDEYQIRYFWWRAIELIMTDYVDVVELESPGVKVVDDVVITYSTPMRDKGGLFEIDYCQLKYHVTQNGSFSFEAMLDPEFTGTKDSFLQRLYDTYQTLKVTHGNRPFRIRIVSPWPWHPDDPVAGCWATEGYLRDEFFDAGPGTKIGKYRESVAQRLNNVTDTSFYDFLCVLRFDSGPSLHSLNQSLDDRLKLATLVPLVPDHLHSPYDDLGRKFITSGRVSFTQQSLFALLKAEGLVLPSKSRAQVTLRSCLEWAKKPLETQSAHLDLTAYFDGRFPLEGDTWSKIVPDELRRFLSSERLGGLSQPIEVFFDCHLSIAFAAGSILSPKCGISLIPVQKTMGRGYEPWECPTSLDVNTGWSIEPETLAESPEIFLAVSVTHDVRKQVAAFIASMEMGHLPTIAMTLSNGPSPLAIRDASHAWSLGGAFRTALQSMLPKTCRRVHLFYAGPAALAFILGANTGGLPSLQLYEHDFEGTVVVDHYYPTLTLPLRAG
jgi:SMODS-associated and fused to various effectors sensor domain